ncbi:hypothetical protein N7528_009210 [Penicillium herquei]|nr:hypothetical protein N7528_009210 [Penicillium herquei]
MPDHPKNASNQLWRDEKEQVDYGALSIFRGDDNERFPDNPALLMSMNNLALTLLDSGQWEEAEVLQAQVCVLNQDLLGEEHPDTLTSQAIDAIATCLGPHSVGFIEALYKNH